MGTRIPLVEHSRPRILAIDFSDQDIRKISELGFNVRRGDSGLYNQNRFRMPWSIHDVEILFANVSQGTFSRLSERTPDQDSIEVEPAINSLLNEIWGRDGWMVFFIKQDCAPSEFTSIGIEELGVLNIHRKYLPTSRFQEALRGLASKDVSKMVESSIPRFPAFTGDAVILNDDKENEPIITILNRFLKSANYSVLTTGKSMESLFGSSNITTSNLITDESSNKNALALKVTKLDTRYYRSTVLLLPDFGKNNINIAVALLQGVIADRYPNLFDAGNHKWLENYLPHTVRQVRAAKDDVLEKTKELLNDLDKRETEEFVKFTWLLGLLTAQGDEFANYAAEALRFLGFQVTVVDETLDAREAKKEDYHIFEPRTGYFAIGEAKTKGRGPGKDFFIATQDHQTRFSRDHNIAAPDAILIVNHSISLDPNIRAGRFYPDNEYPNRCQAQRVIAIDSVALFSMCQCVLRKEIEPEEVRRFIIREHRLISTFEVESAKE